MTTSDKLYLIANYEIDIARYIKTSLEMMRRGFDVSKRNWNLWLIMNYLDLISKHELIKKQYNSLTDEEMNNIVAHMNILLNTNYNIYF